MVRIMHNIDPLLRRQYFKNIFNILIIQSLLLLSIYSSFLCRYTTGLDITENSVVIHDFYSKESATSAVHLLIDTALTNDTLGIKAYTGIPFLSFYCTFPSPFLLFYNVFN